MAFRKNGDATHLGTVEVPSEPTTESAQTHTASDEGRPLTSEEMRLLGLLQQAEVDPQAWVIYNRKKRS